MTDAIASETTERNKALLQEAYAQAAVGNGAFFVPLFAEDIAWTTIGSTRWSKTYHGIAELRAMFARLYALLEGKHLVLAERFVAEGDFVVVQARAQSTTKAGQPYHNAYCIVHRLVDGKIKEVVEYCDTALIAAVL